jgi:hypothetical protein
MGKKGSMERKRSPIFEDCSKQQGQLGIKLEAIEYSSPFFVICFVFETRSVNFSLIKFSSLSRILDFLIISCTSLIFLPSHQEIF